MTSERAPRTAPVPEEHAIPPPAEDAGYMEQATNLVEKANADLQAELLSVAGARSELRRCIRLKRLTEFRIARLAARLDDPLELAQSAGTSVGQARSTIATGTAIDDCAPLASALQTGAISLEQASAIATAETSAPGSATGLVEVAQAESFHVLTAQSRRIALDAEQRRGLAERQRAARRARSHTGDLGMTHIHLALQPHIGAPLVSRAEAEAGRLFRAAKKAAAEHPNGEVEPFERFLADAWVKLLSGQGKPCTTRPELVVLVSHEVVKRGWKDVRPGEHCKIPGVGPVSPEIAKEIAGDAFLSGLFHDGKDLRHIKSWTRSIPREVRLALELGHAPDFDGVACMRCGNHFRIQIDHVEPHCSGGPTSLYNNQPLCHPCHQEKTAADRKAGKLGGSSSKRRSRLPPGSKQPGKRSRRAEPPGGPAP